MKRIATHAWPPAAVGGVHPTWDDTDQPETARPRAGFFPSGGYTARIWLHRGYTEQKAKRPTPKDWPKCLNLLVLLTGIELVTY